MSRLVISILILNLATFSFAKELKVEQKNVIQLMDLLKDRIKKWHWDYSLFPSDGWQHKGYSENGLPLIYWTCGNPNSENKSLILSAVHGDEITPVYYGFRLVEWLKARKDICDKNFVVIAPIVNPDGFLRYTKGTRTNFNKVDLNRNFDTNEWKDSAHHLWNNRYNAQRRYFPGEKPDSENETVFQKWLISEFHPHKVLSIHAPLNFLDYDGPKSKIAEEFSKGYIESCEKLKQEVMSSTPELRYKAFGTFPGSLGNYAGKLLGIPTITAELPTTNGFRAGAYFGLLEKATRKFIAFKMIDAPKLNKRIAKNED